MVSSCDHVRFLMMGHDMTQPLLNRKQAAAYLNMSVSTLARWAHLKEGPPYLKLGRSARYRQSDLDLFLEEAAVSLVGNLT